MYQKIKCVVVGDGAVGKTCLLMAYASPESPFQTDYIPTIYQDQYADVTVGGRNYTIQLCDTSGQEDYDRLRPLAYPNTDVFLICYSVTMRDSYENVKYRWIPELKHFAPKTPFLLVGTQTDMRQSTRIRCIRDIDGIALATELRTKYVECSAKSMVGVKNVFDEAIRACLYQSTPRTTKPKKMCQLL